MLRTQIDWPQSAGALLGALAVFGTLVGVAAPGRATTLTLAEAVSQALQQGNEATIAHLEAGQASAAVDAARSVYWPKARFGSKAGWSNRQNDTLNAINGQGQLKEYPLSGLGSSEPWISLTVNQILFDLSRWRNVDRVELQAEVASAAEAEQRESISFTVLDRYLDVLRLEQLTALDETRAAQAAWLDEQAARLLEAGRLLPDEREQAALNVEQVGLERATHQEELTAARAQLWEAVRGTEGEDESSIQLVPSSLPTPTIPTDADSDSALSGAPELRVLDLRRRMEESRLGAARASRYPTLALRGGYFHYGTKRFDSFEQEVAVGIDLEVPVFDGFEASATIDDASKGLEVARLRYEAARDGARARVRDLLRRLSATARQPDLARRQADVARERVRLADLQLQAQRGTLAQALAARNQAAHDAGAAIEASAERTRMWARLKRETGQLAAALGGASAAPATP